MRSFLKQIQSQNKLILNTNPQILKKNISYISLNSIGQYDHGFHKTQANLNLNYKQANNFFSFFKKKNPQQEKQKLLRQRQQENQDIIKMLQIGELKEGYEKMKSLINTRVKNNQGHENYQNREYDNLILGLFQKKMNNYELAINEFEQAKKFAIDSNSQQMLVSILMNLGATYQLQNKKKESINSYINAYEVGIALEHNDPQYINSLIMLGDLECQGSFLQTALQYYQRGLKECLKLINNLKIEYQDLTEQFQELQKQKNFQKDIKYHQITGRQNYLEATIRKAQISLAILYINQGKIFAVLKKKQDSFESLNLARDIYRDLKKQSQNSLMHFNQIKSQLSSQERESEQTYLDYLQRQTNVLIGSLDSQEALIQYNLEKDAENAFRLLTESDQNYKTNENINETDFITHLVNKQKLFAKICVDDKINQIKIFQQNPQKFQEEIQNTMNQFNKYKTNFKIQQQQGQKQNTSNQDEFNDLKILKLSVLFEFYGTIINNYTQKVQDQNQTLQKLLQQYNRFNENEQYSIEVQDLVEQILQFKQDYQLTQDLKNLEQTLYIIRQRQDQEATSKL